MQGLDGWIGVHQAVKQRQGPPRCTAGRKPADAMLGEQAHLPLHPGSQDTPEALRHVFCLEG